MYCESDFHNIAQRLTGYTIKDRRQPAESTAFNQDQLGHHVGSRCNTTRAALAEHVTVTLCLAQCDRDI
jgi:hypothetical protein